MRVICDVEANGFDPTKLWCIVCREIDTSIVHTFVRPDLNPDPFLAFAKKVTVWIGHNFIGYDRVVINKLVSGINIEYTNCLDTLVCSRLFNFDVEDGHSLAAWGNRLGCPKTEFKEFDEYEDPEKERDRLKRCVSYCVDDTFTNREMFLFLEKHIYNPIWRDALRLEHDTAYLCVVLNKNGFYFNYESAQDVYSEINKNLLSLAERISDAFPPRPRLVRHIVPRSTKAGTISRVDFRWCTSGDLTPYSVGAEFSLIEWEEFNPGSPQQVVERLNQFGWRPFEKTKGHIQAERDARRCRNREEYERVHVPRLEHFQTYGWKVSEENLDTLPDDAPEPARLLVQWRFLEKRRQTLDEWFQAYNPTTNRIHGRFNHIGTWTGRMSHSNPNMGNVPSVNSKYNSQELKDLAKYYGTKMRSAWCVPNGRRLVGVDADGIQLRVLAHLMDDKDFTEALVNGKKENGTDAHTLNAIKLGIGPKRRDNAKTFIYAWLLGAGLDKIAKILDTNREGAEIAYENFLNGYPALRRLKEVTIPEDQARGFIYGLDGRLVKLPKEGHFGTILGCYLQNGESLVMKRATQLWQKQLTDIDYLLVNFVHDEWEVEVEDNDDVANFVAETMKESIKQTGIDFKLKCPLLGSSKIGYNWYDVH